MNPHFPAFKRIITNPVLFKFFVFQKLSSAFWAGLSIARFDEKSCEVRVKLSWFNQNPFRSMYFAVEAMAAGSKLQVPSIGRNQAGEIVAEFYLTWTFKAKSL